MFDFERGYWYEDYMKDLRLRDGYQYLLAGDYFIDIIRSAHLLLVNKDVYAELHKANADALYDDVLNYKWTVDKLYSITNETYFDQNANSARDEGDRYGFVSPAYWGSSIPFIVSGTPNFITRDDDGTPAIAIGECNRVNDISLNLNRLFMNRSSFIAYENGVDATTMESVALEIFASNRAVVLGYQRLGSLEDPILKGMESDFAILPYPMLMESDKKYTTSTHDTAEVGAIMTTSIDNMEFISTVIEVLNRETANTLMPKYYKEGLQVMYVDDSKAAAMIDIIHDNFGATFSLAYNDALGDTILKGISNASASGSGEFKGSNSQRIVKAANSALNKILATFDNTAQ